MVKVKTYRPCWPCGLVYGMIAHNCYVACIRFQVWIPLEKVWWIKFWLKGNYSCYKQPSDLILFGVLLTSMPDIFFLWQSTMIWLTRIGPYPKLTGPAYIRLFIYLFIYLFNRHKQDRTLSTDDMKWHRSMTFCKKISVLHIL